MPYLPIVGTDSLLLMPHTALYVTSQGARVCVRGHRLVVETRDGHTSRHGLIHLHRLYLFGSVQLTTQAIAALLARQIPVAFLSLTGRLKGCLIPPVLPGVEARLAQMRAALDETRRLELARRFVAAKVCTSSVLLQAHARRTSSPSLRTHLDQLHKVATRLSEAANHAELVGLEGTAAAAYFRGLKELFKGPLTFPGRRSRRPPLDPVNALLSLGYTLLVAEARLALMLHGLDPAVGFLHITGGTRPSLACDLVEPFRAPLIDRLVLDLCNRRRFTAADFERRDGGCLLRRDGLGRAIGAVEDALRAAPPAYVKATLSPTPDGVETLSFREFLSAHAAALSAHLRHGASFLDTTPLR